MLVRFEVFTAVTMKNAVFWDVTPCGSCKNRPFGGTYLHQDETNQRAHPDDGGDAILRNVCSNKSHTSYPRRRKSLNILSFTLIVVCDTCIDVPVLPLIPGLCDTLYMEIDSMYMEYFVCYLDSRLSLQLTD
jgi:hypothetical protein